MKKLLRTLVTVLLFVFALSSVFSQSASDRGFAEEEFRRGVQAFYRGSFNDAILQFEKALTYLPEENLIIEWLGKAYYRAGMEGAAIQEWTMASEAGYGGQLLENTIEIVRNRRILGAESFGENRFVEARSFPNSEGEQLFFSYPVSVAANDDGSFWLVAYGSNEILRYDTNGILLDRIRGPLTGFDRPMDILRLSSGNFVISEFAGNRISFLDAGGNFIRSAGESGRGDNGLVGPQYLAEDSNGNIFVTDFGNGRVCVFDENGDFLFYFGEFTAPTGIAVLNDEVFVADGVTGAVYIFDTAGNYQGQLVKDGTFALPESIKIIEGKLVISDTTKVILLDPVTGALKTIADIGNSDSRITGTALDKNNNLLVTDFDQQEVLVLSEMSEIVGGLYVEIARVNADKFPSVQLELRIQNRKQQPVVGLKGENFTVTEKNYSVNGQTLLGKADLLDSGDITIIIDRSVSMKAYEKAVNQAVTEIASSMGGKGNLRIIAAGAFPSTELIATPASVYAFQSSQLKTDFSSTVPLDLALRLATNDLINASYKRSVVFITDGGITANAFNNYTLSDLSAYLANNGVNFSVISVTSGAISSELDYLVENTGGLSWFLYRPTGIGGLAQELWSIPTGVYTLSYTSSLSTNFGNAYLPVEVEVYLYNRSGRAEAGYYSPLE